jgi:hypothetical protein
MALSSGGRKGPAILEPTNDASKTDATKRIAEGRDAWLTVINGRDPHPPTFKVGSELQESP